MTSHRILIVDDDVEALHLVGLMLKRKGHSIIAATSGQQALDKAMEAHPDLIILDIMMPDMDGYQVASQLRHHPVTANIPILMFTAKTTVNDKIAGFQAGADDYLTKPIHPAELITRVEALLQRQTQANVKLEKGHVIGFLPSKGGIGTTTLALNTALALQQQHPAQHVALVELRAGSGTLAMQLGVTTSGGLQKLLEVPLATLDANTIIQHVILHNSGLHLLLSKASPEGIGPQITQDYARTIVHYLNVNYDYVLIDLPLSVTQANVEALQMADEIILTLAPNQIGLTLAQEMLNSLNKQNINAHKVKVVLLHCAPTVSSLTRHTIEQKLHCEMIGNMPPMPDLAYESARTGCPIVTLQPDSTISQQVHLVVKSISKNP